uniref:Uncharacterized protein n=1 Tax=Lactuca sativa TaxID=4236 RepID=A0A9R1UK77_LACSA|nr:hypothetical protein LSAT_V11C900484160 [Lactuca sativa]
MGGGRSCSNGSCCFVPGDFVEWERAGNNLITTYEFGGEFGSRDSVSWMVVARHNSNSNTTTTVSCLLLLKIVDFKFYDEDEATDMINNFPKAFGLYLRAHLSSKRKRKTEATWIQVLLISAANGFWYRSGQLLNADKWLLLFNQRSSSYKTFDIWFFKVCEAKKVEHETHLERKTI